MPSVLGTNPSSGGDTGLKALKSSSGSPVPPVTNPAYTNSLKCWVHLSHFRRLVDRGASSFGPLKATVTDLAECIGICEDIANGKKEYEALRDELEQTFEMLGEHYGRGVPPAITASVESLWKDIAREIESVKVKLNRDRLERLKDASDDLNDVLKGYGRVHNLLQRVSLNADISMWRIVDGLATEHRLDRLQPAMSACYNSTKAVGVKRGPCTQGTRTEVINQIAVWVDISDPGSVYWMNGMAGTGKTTISYSLCKQLEASGKLAASFFCTRLLPECRDVDKIIPSIAYQLARFSHPFRCALSDILERTPDIHTRQLDMQFEALIVQPLLNSNHPRVKDTLPENLVVVIDALDECENKQSTSHVLALLLAGSTNLPVKFILSSRPESQIRDHMSEQSIQPGSRVVLHELDEGTVQWDIKTYLRSALAQMQLTESEISALAERAGVLFIHAATLVRYISYDNFRGNSRARLENVLHASPAAGKKDIDELYTTVLVAVFYNPELDDTEKDDIRNVLHTVICAKEPLTVDAISKLLRMNDAGRVRTALRPLWSILQISGTNELVTTLHASFPEYMLDPSRSKEYYCNISVHSHILALGCFDCFRQMRPQFNICGLESSFIPDGKVPELNARVEHVITTEVFCAARYWADHLHSAIESPDLIGELEGFLSKQLLLWMEVMNLKQQTKNMSEAIHLAHKWGAGFSEDLKALICDAGWFTMTFASTPVSEYTPHIYTSILAFWPRSKPISMYYSKRMQGMIEIRGTGPTERQHALGATWHPQSSIESAIFSPDGTQIAVGVDKGIVLLNPSIGARITPPLEGHSSQITSVEFSSDGARLISGAADRTIRVWSTQTGRTVLGPLKGHTNDILSVAFSPDGSRIISGSMDRTIRIWDAHTGQPLFDLPAILGESMFVCGRKVKYSPDGHFIISVSGSGLVILDAQNGQVLQTLGQNADDAPFHTLDISPNGRYVAAAPPQGGIRAWNIHTCQPALSPLTRATRFLSIASISFSRDGCWIASGGRNSSPVHLWNAETGDLVLGPLDAHTGSIISLSFSPDNSYITSSSYDNTLRLWDTHSTLTSPNSLHGHTTSITSVSVSHDGAWVASSSEDGTVYVWDAESGQLVTCIPRTMFAHVQWPISDEGDEQISTKVLQVGFSPDSTRIIVNTNRGPYVFDATTGSIRSLYTGHKLSGHPFLVSLVLGLVVLGMLFVGSPHVYGSIGGSATTPWTLSHVLTLLLGLRRLFVAGLRMDIGLHTPANPVGALIAQAILLLLTGVRVFGDIVFGPVDIYSPNITCAAFSPDGTRIVSGSVDGVIRVHDAYTNQLILAISLPATNEDSRRLNSVSFSSDGRRIFSQSGKRKQRMYCVDSGKLLADLNHTKWSNWSGAGWFSPDGTRVLIQHFDSASLVGLRTGKTLHLKGSPSLETRQPTKWRRLITFTADGSRIAFTMDDGSVGIWSAQTGESLIAPFQIGVRPVTSMALSPDGGNLITGLKDGTICIANTHPAPTEPSDNAPVLSDWKLSHEGWVVDEQSRPLVWVPSELRLGLMRPRTKRQMSRNGWVQLELEGTYLGESWAQCYKPE